MELIEVCGTFYSVDASTYDGAALESPSHAVEEKVGVLLLNLGGPETLNDVQPFLFNLFADPALALKMALEAKGLSSNVYVGMQYWYPFTEEAVQQIGYSELHFTTLELKARGISNDHTLACQTKTTSRGVVSQRNGSVSKFMAHKRNGGFADSVERICLLMELLIKKNKGMNVMVSYC